MLYGRDISLESTREREMADFRDRVEVLLRDSEGKLIELLAEAGEARDYDSVEMIRSVARELDDLASSVSEGNGIISGVRSDASRSDASREDDASPSRARRGRYPRFVVNGKALEKIGWSPKRGTEYSHRIPRAEFDAVVHSLEAMARESDGDIGSGEILDKLGDRVKHYQVYGVLRFLRSTDVIAPAARGAYAVPNDVADQASQAWKRLEKS